MEYKTMTHNIRRLILLSYWNKCKFKSKIKFGVDCFFMAILLKDVEVKVGVSELMKNGNIRDDISEFGEMIKYK